METFNWLKVKGRVLGHGWIQNHLQLLQWWTHYVLGWFDLLGIAYGHRIDWLHLVRNHSILHGWLRHWRSLINHGLPLHSRLHHHTRLHSWLHTWLHTRLHSRLHHHARIHHTTLLQHLFLALISLKIRVSRLIAITSFSFINCHLIHLIFQI